MLGELIFLRAQRAQSLPPERREKEEKRGREERERRREEEKEEEKEEERKANIMAVKKFCLQLIVASAIVLMSHNLVQKS